MHKRKKESRLTYYAKISVVVSLTLLLYGIVLDIDNNKRLFDSFDDNEIYEDGKSTISITTSDGSEVVPGNIIVTSDDGGENTNSNPSSPSNKSSNNGGNGSNEYYDQREEINNDLRNNIQNTYGIIVRYGNETENYSVGGFATTSIQDPGVVYEQLNKLKAALNLYPSGFFNEIKNGGIPLSVYLVYSYSNASITGITDSSYTYAIISIAAAHPFEESFYHESYHYIERFLFKRGANFNNWNTINPPGFTYGIVDQRLSYTYAMDANAPFVNDYAQTADTEDRASTFEYMMASTQASCMNQGTTVHTKAYQMALAIDAVLNTVKPNTMEYWERFL